MLNRWNLTESHPESVCFRRKREIQSAILFQHFVVLELIGGVHSEIRRMQTREWKLCFPDMLTIKLVLRLRIAVRLSTLTHFLDKFVGFKKDNGDEKIENRFI